jgi:hypothetical protein
VSDSKSLRKLRVPGSSLCSHAGVCGDGGNISALGNLILEAQKEGGNQTRQRIDMWAVKEGRRVLGPEAWS